VQIDMTDDGIVQVVDLGSTNGSFIDGAPAEGRVTLAPGSVLEVGATMLSLELPSMAQQAGRTRWVDGRLDFNRPPRVTTARSPLAFQLPTAPAVPRKTRLPLAAAVVPVVLGVVMFLLLKQAALLLFIALGPIMAIWTYIDDRRGGRHQFREAARRFNAELADMAEKLESANRQEERDRRGAAPAVPQLVTRARTTAPTLWERRKENSDFLALRVGMGDLPTEFTVKLSESGDEEMQRRSRQLRDRHSTARNVPVVVNLTESAPVGIVGDSDEVAAMGRWLTCQAATLHSPRDLAIMVLATPDDEEAWCWSKWLPHTERLADVLGLTRTVGSKPKDVTRLLSGLQEVIASRLASQRRTPGAAMGDTDPDVLVIVQSELQVSAASLSQVLADGPSVGVYAICLAPSVPELPGECRAVVELERGTSELAVTRTGTGERVERVVADSLDTATAAGVARDLAALRDVTARHQGGELPAAVPLWDLIDASELTAPAIADRWAQNGPGLDALVGVSESGPLIVDLHHDGPHALIAGTTGAGKSELLQTLVASLSARHSPDVLCFLLVDYKGGAAFKDCQRLPQTVGLVTDLDEHLTQRALTSLNAELRRREQILRRGGAKDLAELQHRSPSSSPPSLVIVIDEFATLAKEVPDFVTGIVDVAQRGRSLGVHVILATQRPAGVVTDNIRANTNLRIALRVNDDTESTDVIGTPDAARISRSLPGRGYVRTGHGEVRIFQAGYVGGSHASGSSDELVRVADFLFEPVASGSPVGRLAVGDGAGQTDLQALVDAIERAAQTAKIAPPGSPWLEPLPAVFPVASLETSDPGGALAPGAGLLDEPELQRQRTWFVPLEEHGHLLVYGTAGSGKTTFLRTLAASAASSYSSADLQIYGLDGASRGLLALKALRHCGDVVTVDEVERVERLFAMLDAAIEQRRELLGQFGAGSLAEYRQRATGDSNLPTLLILVDGYGGFRSAFDQVDHGMLVDRLDRQVAEGRALGIHFVITAERRGSVTTALAGLIADRVALRMANADEYATVGLSQAAKGATLPPGRGFVGDGTEVQIAIVGDKPSGSDQARALAELSIRLAELREGDPQAPPVQLLPSQIERQALRPVVAGSLRIPFGVEGLHLSTVEVDLDDVPHFLIVGPDRTGRSSGLCSLALGWQEGSSGLETYALTPRRSPLRDLEGWTQLAAGLGPSEELAHQLADQIADRSETSDPVLVVVDDGDELADGQAATAIERIVRRGRDTGVHVIASAQTHVVHRSFAGWLAELKKLKHGLILQPDVDIDGDLFGVRLPRRSVRSFPPGRGYLTRRGTVQLVQVAN
jgi:S-DNA-T family DNA segregation ATPase FtsK/SpoIIIE